MGAVQDAWTGLVHEHNAYGLGIKVRLGLHHLVTPNDVTQLFHELDARKTGTE